MGKRRYFSRIVETVQINGQWFARPSGPGSDVGPFSTEAQALEWMADIRPTTTGRDPEGSEG